MTDPEHSVLLTRLRAHPGPVVLLGYRSSLYIAALGDWYATEHQTLVEIGRLRCEVLWLDETAAERLGYRQLHLLELDEVDSQA